MLPSTSVRQARTATFVPGGEGRGRRVVAGGDDGRVGLFRLRDGEVLTYVWDRRAGDVAGRIVALAASEVGNDDWLIAATGDGTVATPELATGRTRSVATSGSNIVRRILGAPGRYALAQYQGELEVRDSLDEVSGLVVRSRTNLYGATLGASRDLRYLAHGSADGLSVFEVHRPLHSWTRRVGRGVVRRFVFSADSRRIAVLSNEWTLSLWSIRDGSLVGEFTVASDNYYPDNTGLAFDAAGERIVLADAGGALWIWDLPTGREISSLPASAPDVDREFGADTRELA